MSDHDNDFEELPGGPAEQAPARANRRRSASPEEYDNQERQQQREHRYEHDGEYGSFSDLGGGLYHDDYPGVDPGSTSRRQPANTAPMHYVPPDPLSPGQESSIGSDKEGGGDGERAMRVSSIILQAAAEVEKEAQAKATALSAAAIAAQARKMRDRSRMKRAQLDTDSLEADYDLEASMRTTGMPTAQVLGMPGEDFEDGEHDRASPTAKDMRGQKPFVHEGKSYNLPLPPAFALLDIKKGLGGRGQWSLFEGPLAARLCLWASLVLLVLLLLLGFSLAAAYIALQPKAPQYSLQEVQVGRWTTWKDDRGVLAGTGSVNGSVVPTVYLYAQAALLVVAKNRNAHLGIHYEETKFDITYQGQPIGSGSIPKHYQPPNNETVVKGEWVVNGVPVPHVGHYLEADDNQGQVPLHVTMIVKASVEVWGMISPHYSYSAKYDITIKPPPSEKA